MRSEKLSVLFTSAIDDRICEPVFGVVGVGFSSTIRCYRFRFSDTFEQIVDFQICNDDEANA